MHWRVPLPIQSCKLHYFTYRPLRTCTVQSQNVWCISGIVNRKSKPRVQRIHVQRETAFKNIHDKNLINFPLCHKTPPQSRDAPNRRERNRWEGKQWNTVEHQQTGDEKLWKMRRGWSWEGNSSCDARNKQTRTKLKPRCFLKALLHVQDA